MAHHFIRVIGVFTVALASTAVLAAPKPFDQDLAAGLTAVPPIPLPADEEVVLRYIVNCAPPLRLCQEAPLNLDGGGSDMIVGVNEAGSPNRFYSGRTDGLFRPSDDFGLRVAATSGLKLADLDGDGDLDMVESARANGTTGHNTVYVNRTGTVSSLLDGAEALDSGKHDRSSGVVIGDVNGDGKLDVVISNETTGGHEVTATAQSNYLYLNTTTSANNVRFGNAIALDASGTAGYTRRVLLIDVEGDNDLDLVATSAATSADGAGNGNVLYVNTGGNPGDLFDNPFAAAVPLNTSTADNTDVANAIAAGDLDGDGDPDLVFSTWATMSGGVAVEARNRFYINNSTAGNINFETTGTFGAPARHTNVRLADFDNDSDLDLLALVYEGRSVLHRNVGAPGYFDAGFPLVAPAGFPSDRSRGADFADLNGDDSLDVVIVNRNQLGLRYLNNDKCSPAGCGVFAGPFENDGPEITMQVPAPVPPGVAPIDLNTLLDSFTVVDSDNVYPTDFTALVSQPNSEYTCTDGIVAGGDTAGTCINGRITPTAAADDDLVIGPFDFKVRDGETSSDGFSARLSVRTGSAPVFTTSTVLPPASEDAPYTTTIAATDSDGDVLVFTSENPLPTWLGLSAGGVLSSVTPPRQGDVGSQTITVRVTDSSDLFAIRAFTLAVTNVNDKPTVTTTTLPNGNQNQAYSTTVTASDEDGTTPTFATPNTSLPTGLTLSAAGVISGTPTVSGTFQVVLVATDGTLSSDPVTVPLTIVAAAGANASPVLTAPSAQTATVGTAFSLTVTATDADSDPLTFTAAGLPADLSISAAGVISGTPTSTTGSPFTVTVNVSDGRGGTDSETFQLTVQPQGNRAPAFTAPGPQSGTVGVAFNLSLAGSATDADGDPLSFAATGLPPGIALSTAGLLSGSPTTATGSPFAVTVTVSDGRGGTTPGSFQFTVSNPTSGGSGGGSSGGGGSFGFLEVLGLLGMGALAARRRRAMSHPSRH